MSKGKNKQDGFQSNIGTILALAGSAVGLGNIWRFPYVVGENGGAAFILVYLLIIFFICIPAFMSEFAIGRSTGKNIFGAFKQLSPGTQWHKIGVIGILSCFTISGFYSVISGWTLAFLYKSATNAFDGLNSTELQSSFVSFVNSPSEGAMWTCGFLLLAAFVLVMGVGKGIERYNKILMPMLFLIMLILVFNSFSLSNYKQGFEFMFKPDFSKINVGVVMNALGQAFFSMSLGIGTIITYGSYARKHDNAFKISISTAVMDLSVALLAGMIIFPAVFSYNIPADAGSELAFVTLPAIFQDMTGGYFFAILFFMLLFIASITSVISLFEVIIAYFCQEFKMKRSIATLITVSSVFVIAVFSAYSLAGNSSLKVGEKSLFDFLDNISASYFMPLGGFFIALYAAWFWSKEENRKELSSSGLHNLWYYRTYRFSIKYVVPIVIVLVFLSQLKIV